jgi:hypothetical protein
MNQTVSASLLPKLQPRNSPAPFVPAAKFMVSDQSVKFVEVWSLNVCAGRGTHRAGTTGCGIVSESAVMQKAMPSGNVNAGIVVALAAGNREVRDGAGGILMAA